MKPFMTIIGMSIVIECVSIQKITIHASFVTQCTVCSKSPQHIVQLQDESESNKFCFAVSANLNLGLLCILAPNPSLFQHQVTSFPLLLLLKMQGLPEQPLHRDDTGGATFKSGPADDNCLSQEAIWEPRQT